MSEFRSAAEEFVTDFLDYVYKTDILDQLDKRTQKMVRSPGVVSLIKQAESVFPARAEDGKAETDKLSAVQVDEAIANAANVIDRRIDFSLKIQKNGSAQGLLERVLEGDVEAVELAKEFIRAERGEKPFIA